MEDIVDEFESANITNKDFVEEAEEEDEGTVEDTVEDTVEKIKITSNNIPKLNDNSNWEWKLLGTIENNDGNASCFLDTGKMKIIFNAIHKKQKEIFDERVSFIKEYCILTFHSKHLFFSNNKICQFINESVYRLSRIELNGYIETERQKDNKFILQNLDRTKLLKSYSYKFHHAFYTALIVPLETILNNLDQSSLKAEDKLLVEAIVATSLETYLLKHLYESQQRKTESRLKIHNQDIKLEHNLVTSPRIRVHPQPSQLLSLPTNPIEFGGTTATNIPPYNLRTQTPAGITAVTTSIIKSGSSSSNNKRKTPSGKKVVSINKIPNNNANNNNISNNLNIDNNSNDNDNDAIDQQEEFIPLQIDENNHASSNESVGYIVESNEINDRFLSLANELKLDQNVIAELKKVLKIEVMSTDCDNQSSFDNSEQIHDASNDNDYISFQKEEEEEDVTDVLTGEVPILNEYNFNSRSGAFNNNIGQPSLSSDLFYLITNDNQYLKQYPLIRAHKSLFTSEKREIYHRKVKESNSDIVLKLQSLDSHKENNCNINMIDIEYSLCDNMKAEWSLFDTKINSEDCCAFLGDLLVSPSEDLLNTSCNFIDYFFTIIDQDFQLNQEEKDNVILCLSFVKEFILDGPMQVNHCPELSARLSKAPIIYIPILTNDVCALVIVELSKQRKEVDVYYYDFYNQDIESFNKSFLKKIIDDKVCKFIDLMFPQSHFQKRYMLKNFKIIPMPNFKEQIRIDSGDKIKSVLLLCASLVSCLVFHDTSNDFALPFKPPEYEKWSSNFDFDMFRNLIFYTVIHRNLHDNEIDVPIWIDELIAGLNK